MNHLNEGKSLDENEPLIPLGENEMNNQKDSIEILKSIHSDFSAPLRVIRDPSGEGVYFASLILVSSIYLQ